MKHCQKQFLGGLISSSRTHTSIRSLELSLRLKFDVEEDPNRWMFAGNEVGRHKGVPGLGYILTEPACNALLHLLPIYHLKGEIL